MQKGLREAGLLVKENFEGKSTLHDLCGRNTSHDVLVTTDQPPDFGARLGEVLKPSMSPSGDQKERQREPSVSAGK